MHILHSAMPFADSLAISRYAGSIAYGTAAMTRFDFDHPPFDSLSHAERQQLEQSADIVYFAPDTPIIGPGQVIDSLYVVIKGTVCESTDDETLARYRAQDSFDARAMVAGHSPHRFVAEEEALLFALPRQQVLALTECNAAFGAYFYSSVSQKMGTLAQRAGSRELQTLFTATVRDVGCRAPVFVDGGLSIREVARCMKQARSKSVLVQDGARLGIFTTTDFRDIILDGTPVDTPVAQCARFELLCIDIDDFLFDALLLMTQRNLRRLVVKENGRAVGMLSQVDVLSYFSNHSHLIAQRLERAESLDELVQAASQVTRLVQILSGHGVRPPQLGRLVQTLNGRLFARAWQLIAPPALVSASCLLVMGSEGRGEQILKTDQDNALLLPDGTDFPELAAACDALSAALARFGYPPCPGSVMVDNPVWRLSSEALRARIRQWVHQPSGEGMMQLAIFLDAEPVSGDSRLLSAGRDYLRQLLQDDASFYARFARAIEQFDTPLGLFAQLQTRSRDGRDLLDLKKGGIFPLVHGLRALALEYGIDDTSSQGRADRLAQSGHLDPVLAGDIREALSFLLQLRLQHGLQQLSRQQPIDNLIEPSGLSTLERDLLKDALAVVKRFKTQLRHHYRLGSL
ncbi:putative nucleotidyltransferase substrate binding domain-containing protein [Paludibacterium purpuratum]|uniref:CBS domain-containing protein n=1 Tax=Paludibacterium purpuratum TaxID=1144873 RepID=A0A4R7AZE2_9NEIS|nr:putative nucleotidyltransferase substrate binding domain-containing protein [Paludibacterium purpuratum]TDR73607.1 CBS domain-containing protein [Paludibacterium purpuratum]